MPGVKTQTRDLLMLIVAVSKNKKTINTIVVK